MHVHDSKLCVMMESIKNLAMSDLVPSFLLLNLCSLFILVSMRQHMSMDSTLQCEAIWSVQEFFCVHDICTISTTT